MEAVDDEIFAKSTEFHFTAAAAKSFDTFQTEQADLAVPVFRMRIAFDAPVYYEFTFWHSLFGNATNRTDTNSMDFSHFLSSDLIHRFMFTNMILFSKTMLRRFFVNSAGYGPLQFLKNKIFTLAAANNSPQIDAVVITKTRFQKARTRQAQAVTGRAETMCIGGNEADTPL